MNKKSNKLKKIIIIIVSLVVILAGAFYIYTLDYYRADASTAEAFSSNADIVEIDDDISVFYPDEDNDANIGIVFYPGGKIENIAYTPLLQSLADQGYTCVLLEMPFNLAVLDIDAADKVYSQFPDITDWYLTGHSLGGAMSSSYAGNNADKLAGLILLGAYPINDAQLPTLVVYGSEDLGLDTTKLEDTENKVELAGGNHAYFGNYGEQKGDGTATMSREEQQEITVGLIVEFIQANQ